jgi:hypothetical protein
MNVFWSAPEIALYILGLGICLPHFLGDNIDEKSIKAAGSARYLERWIQLALRNRSSEGYLTKCQKLSLVDIVLYQGS